MRVYKFIERDFCGLLIMNLTTATINNCKSATIRSDKCTFNEIEEFESRKKSNNYQYSYYNQNQQYFHSDNKTSTLQPFDANLSYSGNHNLKSGMLYIGFLQKHLHKKNS